MDNNTWNNTHIATVGRAMASPEKQAWEIFKSLDCTHVLVVFGGFIGYTLCQSCDRQSHTPILNPDSVATEHCPGLVRGVLPCKLKSTADMVCLGKSLLYVRASIMLVQIP